MKKLTKLIQDLRHLCVSCESLVWRLGALISLVIVMSEIIANHSA